MGKYLKILKKRYKPVLAALVLLLIALQFVPFRVFIKKSDVGGGYLKENQEEVEFLCFGDIYNLSFRPCTVILEITSRRDMEDGYLANENLEVNLIEIQSGEAGYPIITSSTSPDEQDIYRGHMHRRIRRRGEWRPSSS